MIQYHSENYGKIIKPLGIVFTMVRGTRMMSEVISGPGETSAGARYIFENYEKFYVLCGGSGAPHTFSSITVPPIKDMPKTEKTSPRNCYHYLNKAHPTVTCIA